MQATLKNKQNSVRYESTNNCENFFLYTDSVINSIKLKFSCPDPINFKPNNNLIQT